MPTLTGGRPAEKSHTAQAAGGFHGYDQILDAIALGVLVVDGAGRITYVNAAASEMLGYEPGELLAHDDRAHEVLHHSRADGTPYPLEQCPSFASVRDGARASVHASDGEVLWRKDGTSFPVAYASAPMTEDGAVVGAAIVFSDATERLQRQDERATFHRHAAEAEKLATMGTLVSGLSHEIKTPLTILQNNTAITRMQMEREAARSPEVARLWHRMRDRFGEIDEAVDRMTALVGELRRFSRLDESRATPASLEDVVQQAARLFQLAYRSSVQVDLDLRPTRPVLVDVLKAQQLLMNLLENAADAVGRHGGRVWVRTRMQADDRRALLIVEDDGPGIPPHVQAEMYDPLYTTKRDGTGLGLAIVKRTAEEHGATLACETEPGKGTTFTVGFPLARYT